MINGLSVAVLFLVAMTIVGPAHAWNRKGHGIVAYIAEQQLTPVAKNHIKKWLHTPLPGERRLLDHLWQVAAWADDLKGRDIHTFDQWHYINLPNQKTPNVVWGIEEVRARLRDPKASSMDKAIALRLLVHLVADVHQPLHCIGRDRGGNDFPIRSGFARNLHQLWDRGLGLLVGRRRGLSRSIMQKWPRQSFVWQDDVLGWAMDSHRIAKQAAFTLKPNTRPSHNYLRVNRSVVQLQLALAGYRLAMILNKL